MGLNRPFPKWLKTLHIEILCNGMPTCVGFFLLGIVFWREVFFKNLAKRCSQKINNDPFRIRRSSCYTAENINHSRTLRRPWKGTGAIVRGGSVWWAAGGGGISSPGHFTRPDARSVIHSDVEEFDIAANTTPSRRFAATFP